MERASGWGRDLLLFIRGGNVVRGEMEFGLGLLVQRDYS
jgi:hypothetical protein